MKRLNNVKCFLLDMDGTVYLSGEVIEGAREAVERMRRRGRVVFLTNNTSVSRADYVLKLSRMGFDAEPEDVYTAGNATADYLKEYHGGKKVFLLGTDSLRAEFGGAGIPLCADNPDLVVIGFDTSLTYKNLTAACDFIREGVPYLLTHPDINCPKKDGYMPDVGSFAALIKTSTAREPFIICGKPHKPIADGVKKLTGFLPYETAMVGDRLATDMAFAKNNGFISVLVLTGATSKSDLKQSGASVDVVLDSVAFWDI
ncbi:MAG: HAD-IIA family hydrolase [Clostridiales bacterium]|jgi:HAD superfamily hydrolase (TIGR01450 family)|nr:HAD-IIA family hydrolase [Clostridiales bacterium]